MTLYMHDNQQVLGLREANGGIPRFVALARIGYPDKRVKENFAGQLKWDAMFHQVRCGFPRIPLEYDAMKYVAV